MVFLHPHGHDHPDCVQKIANTLNQPGALVAASARYCSTRKCERTWPLSATNCCATWCTRAVLDQLDFFARQRSGRSSLQNGQSHPPKTTRHVLVCSTLLPLPPAPQRHPHPIHRRRNAEPMATLLPSPRTVCHVLHKRSPCKRMESQKQPHHGVPLLSIPLPLATPRLWLLLCSV
jgi:hypothetical protein